jgi:hypothetical protein
MDYITCDRRKNAPQINVLICEKKCQHRTTCSTYLSYAKVKSLAASLSNCAAGSNELLVMQEQPRPALPTAAGK